MKILHGTEMLQEVCRASKKWGMFVNLNCPVNIMNCWGEIEKAAPYLDASKHHQLIGDGYGYLLFDTEEEMIKTYELTVGDDGPTKSNPYDGPARVYALTCSPEGQFLNENT